MTIVLAVGLVPDRLEGTVTRPEMIRFTQPGAIPATDDAGGTNPKEWFAADHRSVGRRGDKIVAFV